MVGSTTNVRMQLLYWKQLKWTSMPGTVVVVVIGAADENPVTPQSIPRNKGFEYGSGWTVSSQRKFALGSWNREKLTSVLHCFGIVVPCSFKLQAWCERRDLNRWDCDWLLLLLFISLGMSMVARVVGEKEGWRRPFTGNWWDCGAIWCRWWWMGKGFWRFWIGLWISSCESTAKAVDIAGGGVGVWSNVGKEPKMGGEEEASGR